MSMCVCVFVYVCFRVCVYVFVCGQRGSNVVEPKANLKPGKVGQVPPDVDGSQESADSLVKNIARGITDPGYFGSELSFCLKFNQL